jgi:hypothetical protein
MTWALMAGITGQDGGGPLERLLAIRCRDHEALAPGANLLGCLRFEFYVSCARKQGFATLPRHIHDLWLFFRICPVGRILAGSLALTHRFCA